MKIRKVRKEDIEKLWEFEKENRLYDRKLIGPEFKIFFSWDIIPKEKKEWINFIKKDITKKDRLVFIAEENKDIVGYISGEIHHFKHPKYPQKTGYVKEFFVSQKERGKGIGSKLMKELLKGFKSNKIKFVSLDVYSANEPAIKIYKKWGFKPFFMNMKKRLR